MAGTLVPLGLRAMRVDPALASSVFITTLTDLFGFLILSFAIWGIGDIFANRGLTKPVLRVGDLTYITDTNYISDEEKEKIKGSRVLVLDALQMNDAGPYSTPADWTPGEIWQICLIRPARPAITYPK